MPPSTVRICPVTNAASSVSRNRIAAVRICHRLGRHRCGDRPGRHAVDAHVGGRKLQRHRADQSVDAGFRCSIGGRARMADLANLARDEHDRAASLPLHGLATFTRDDERTAQVDVEHAVPVVGFGLEGTQMDEHAGGGDEPVDTAECVYCLACRSGGLRRVGEIGSVAPVGRNEFVERSAVLVNQRGQGRAGARRKFQERSADPRIGARDEQALAAKAREIAHSGPLIQLHSFEAARSPAFIHDRARSRRLR